jgi:hypothetical protein
LFNTGECPLCVTWALDPDKAQRIGLSQDVHVKRQPLVLVLSVTLLSSTVLLAPAALAAPFAPEASTEQGDAEHGQFPGIGDKRNLKVGRCYDVHFHI